MNHKFFMVNEQMTYKHIKLVQFEELSFWDYYTLIQQPKIKSFFPLVKLGEVLNQRKKYIKIEGGKEYKRCRVQLYGKGVVLRDKIKGQDIRTKKQYVCKVDDFLVAEIDAKLGGYGIVPDFLEEAIVSSHYFLFEINKSKLDPNYLSILVKLDGFSSQVRATGSTNYAAIRPRHVLNYKIPIPPLNKQKRLVDAYLEKMRLADEMEQEITNIAKLRDGIFKNKLKIKFEENLLNPLLKVNIVNFESITRWDVWNQSPNIISIYPIIELGNIMSSITTGTTPPSSVKEYFSSDINFYTPSDLGNTMDLLSAKRGISNLAVKHNKARIYPKNTLLIVGIGSTIGKVGIIRNSIASSNQQITGLFIDEKIACTEYVYYFINAFRDYVIKERTESTIPILNQEKIKKLKIPLPPINIQKAIIYEIDNIRKKKKLLVNKSRMLRNQAISDFEKAIFKTKETA